MDILVTGGTGFLGQHLAEALLARGHKTYMLGRNFEQAGVRELIARGAISIIADLRDRFAVEAACEGKDVICHAGALSAPWGKRNDFYEINVGGTEGVIAGCREYGVRRLIYISSPSVVFDGNDQSFVSEDVPYPRRFASIYSLTKKLGEDRVNEAGARGLQTVILRPKAIFGPGDQALLPRLIAAAKQRRLPQIGNGQNLVDLTYVENVVHAILLALDSTAVVGKTYTVTNDEHVRLWDVIRYVLGQLNLSTHLRQIPLSLALSAASLMEIRAALVGREPLLTRYSAAILARNQTYDISSVKRDLHYAPCVSIDKGIANTLEVLKEQV
jgi:nucleoside-diphosphate-sugar epimerase